MSIDNNTGFSVDFRSVDLDALLAPKPTMSSSSDGRYAFWNAKQDASYTFYFVTDPWTKHEDFGWYGWREIFAQNGFVGGITDVPGGLRGVPVDDSHGPDSDPLLALVEPYIPRFGDHPRPIRPVETKVGFNIVQIENTDNGVQESHRILVVSEARYKAIIQIINGWRDVSENFSLLGRKFVLSFPKMQPPVLQISRDSMPIDLPQPYNIPLLLQLRRDQLMDHIEAESGVSFGAARDDVKFVEPDVAEEVSLDGVDDFAEIVKEVNLGPSFDDMTDARITQLLKKAGVPVKPGMSRTQLIGLATTNL
jgi:hypothetical protein